MTATLTRDDLRKAGACASGIALFDKHAATGCIEYTAERDAQLRSLDEGFWAWVRDKKVVPKYPYGSGSGDGYGSGSGDG